MAIDFIKAKNYSWMSQASYLDLSTVVIGDKNGLVISLRNSLLNIGKKFSSDQATVFTDATTGYSLISQQPNTPNGTSLTVFKSNADGSYTIAVRGTEEGTVDFVVDALGVVGAGLAHSVTHNSNCIIQRLDRPH